MIPDRAYLDLRNVKKSFRAGAEPVLRGVSLSVPRGELTALVGPSGSGKSTLLAVLGALDRADEGTVRVGAVDLTTASRRALGHYRRTEVGFVFQTFNLLRSLSAVENVEVTVPEDRRARALAALDQVGLAAHAHKLPHELSGGQQQRVAIARAIARRPALLLADEPTGSLDRETGTAVLDLLLDLRRSLGITCVLVTHDVALAARADRVVRMADGVIAA